MAKRDPLTTVVVACNWRRTPDGWKLWVKGRKDVCGVGETFDAAEEALQLAIMQAAPDLDAVLPIMPDYDPPLPVTALAQPYLDPELYVIFGDEIFESYGPRRTTGASAETEAAWMSSFYTEGVCPTCGHGRGERTAVAIRADHAPRRGDAGYVRFPALGMSVYVFSARFLELLTPEERARPTLRPIEMPPGSRRPFYELCGRPDVEFVGVRGFDADGIECRTCGYRSVLVKDPRLSEEGLGLAHFICAADLPDSHASCFTVGWGSNLDLCVSRERWDALRGHCIDTSS